VTSQERVEAATGRTPFPNEPRADVPARTATGSTTVTIAVVDTTPEGRPCARVIGTGPADLSLPPTQSVILIGESHAPTPGTRAPLALRVDSEMRNGFG